MQLGSASPDALKATWLAEASTVAESAGIFVLSCLDSCNWDDQMLHEAGAGRENRQVGPLTSSAKLGPVHDHAEESEASPYRPCLAS